MIRMMGADALGAVKLFQQNQIGQPMGQRHWPQRQNMVGGFDPFRIMAFGPADHKGGLRPTGQGSREFSGSQCDAAPVQRNHGAFGGQNFANAIPFIPQAALFAGSLTRILLPVSPCFSIAPPSEARKKARM